MVNSVSGVEVQGGSQLVSKTKDNNTVVKNELDRAAFLRLLVTELTYQDPMDPVDNKEFIAQLAQFSTLEAVESMSKGFENVAAVSKWNWAVSLMGKTVSGVSEKGDTSGVVNSIELSDGEINLLLDNGEKVPISTIKEVN